ncbi:MAG: exopolysaccharide Pel transporter PelG [Myxococcales bacterium]|nr:exopolysaccharide Pel transporter PelG [Myxococcales bacterium]
MAGIGFSLRKHLRKETYFGFFTAYLLAGVIGSGPWVVSICSMLLIGTLSPAFGAKGEGMSHFLATVTQLMAASLVLSGLLQLMFTRFIADRTFEEDEEAVVPNLFGALLVTTIGSALVATPVAAFGFADGGHHAYRVLLVCAFVTLCDMWVVTVILSGMKGYWSIVLVFLLGYGITLGAALALAPYGAPGYLAGFCMGHGAMLFAMLVLITRAYPASKLIAFQFLDKKRVFPELALAGVFFNLGIWADKFVFWAYPLTSETLVGPIRYSVIYDVPIFVAYLTVIPGMAAFLVRIETDFAEKFAIFFDAVRKGTSFQRLTVMRSDLVDAAREGIYDVFRIQGLAVATLLVLTPRVLRLFRIPSYYSHLFQIDVVAAGFQVVLLSMFTILFYLDYRKLVLYLCVLFFVANTGLSLLTLALGPRFYGLGFVVAGALTSLLAMGALSRKLERLEYETFMR